MALPPESLHVVCIGYMAHLIQSFSWVRKLRSGATSEDDCRIHYVFGETYRREEQLKAKLKKIGELLQRQPDPRKPRTDLIHTSLNRTPKTKTRPQQGKNRHMKCEVSF